MQLLGTPRDSVGLRATADRGRAGPRAQGGGKRKGAFAVYLEPWHADIFDFLDLRKNTGARPLL